MGAFISNTKVKDVGMLKLTSLRECSRSEALLLLIAYMPALWALTVVVSAFLLPIYQPYGLYNNAVRHEISVTHIRPTNPKSPSG